MEIAVPKGRLLAGVQDILKEAGIEMYRKSDRCYTFTTNVPGLTGMVVKPRAIPQLLALGSFDFGFCGRDLVWDSPHRLDLASTLDLGLNPVRIVVAVHESQADILVNRPTRPVVIATEYEVIAAEWALERRLPAIIVNTYGSTEGYAPRKADIVLDCVETGDTMRANGLVILEDLFGSTTLTCTTIQKLCDPDVEDLNRRLQEAIRRLQSGPEVKQGDD